MKDPIKPIVISEAQRDELKLLQTRDCRIEGREDLPKDGTVPIAFSTEAEVNRGWYIEILDHGPGAVVLDNAREGMGFLLNHDRDQLVGRAKNVRVDKDRVGRADVVFSSAAEAQQIRQDMLDGIRPDISVGYLINDYIEEQRDGQLYIRATKWTPKEASSVSIPADYKAGVGRSDPAGVKPLPPKPDNKPETERTQTTVSTANTKESAMLTPEEIAAQKAAEKAALDARAAETRDGAAKILQIAEVNKIPLADARKAIAENWTVERFQELALAKVRENTPGPLPAIEDRSVEGITGSRTEAKRYSFARAIVTALAMREGRTPEPCFELEVSRELAKKLPSNYKDRGGILAPMEVLKRDGMDSINPTKGTELKADMQPGELIELLRAASVVLKMGAQTLSGLTGPLPFPKQNGAASFYWVGENSGTAVTKSNPTFGTVSLNPKTLMATIPYSRQLVQLGTPSAEQIVRNEMAIGAALAVDKAALYGTSAAGQPMGLYSIPDVNAVAMGGAVAFGELVDMATECAKDNALLGTLGYVTTPGMAGKLMQVLEASSAGSKMIWVGRHDEGTVAGYVARATNQMSSVMTGSAETGGSEHGIIFGNWADIIFGTWGVQELIVDPFTRKGEAMIEVTSYQLADVLARHGESFCKATGATLA